MVLQYEEGKKQIDTLAATILAGILSNPNLPSNPIVMDDNDIPNFTEVYKGRVNASIVLAKMLMADRRN